MRHATRNGVIAVAVVSGAMAVAGPVYADSAADGSAEVWLGLSLRPGHLLVTVSDPGDEPPAYTPTDDCALREHGRGLYIVDALAEEWGWTSRPPAGKTVWAKLSTAPPP